MSSDTLQNDKYSKHHRGFRSTVPHNGGWEGFLGKKHTLISGKGMREIGEKFPVMRQFI
jgi:hypothetical protein